MTKFGKIILFVSLLVVLSVVIFVLQREPNVIEAPTVSENPAPSNEVPQMEYDKTLLEGKAEDLIYFSVVPNALMPKGILSYRGSIKGAYFFEGNILINILDTNLNVLKASNAVAKTEWMTVDPVEFEGNIDFTGLPSGPAYFEIHNDNASGLPENDKYVRIPIIIQ